MFLFLAMHVNCKTHALFVATVQTSHPLEYLQLMQYFKFQMAKILVTANYGQTQTPRMGYNKWILYTGKFTHTKVKHNTKQKHCSFSLLCKLSQ